MQQSEIASGIVSYGGGPKPKGRNQLVLPPMQPTPVSTAISNSARRESQPRLIAPQTCDVVFICDFSMAVTTTIVSSRCMAVAVSIPEGFELVGPATVRIENYNECAETEPRQDGPNPIIEMRSTRRSLRDKAREEMSEFEREYPW